MRTLDFCQTDHLDVAADLEPPANVASQQEQDHTLENQTKSNQNGDERPAPDTGNHYRQYYQANATVWALYLKETEAEDKELAQLWQTGLDQLLIFVCHFFAVRPLYCFELL